ncbi:DUF3089 domain-containing protein [Limnovirga soli]|uniref:DUF3089 domain-containing protein n=1 Tax=Limnovirga soli TaxID=2656915 RepID=A0A8J8JWN5_9BACT|nr:DUF3089 domain-containing protein [Limnovirga soli]NNV57919.1 DUF3089 domain-containing protein [Limnovirga soli]
MKYLRTGGVFLWVIMMLVSCSSKTYLAVTGTPSKVLADGTPDFSDMQNWAAHPWKKDPSDSVPKPLRKQYAPDTSVDVFFLYPTSYLDKAMPYGLNAPIDNAAINNTTDNASILYQASIFNASGRVFAPRYRQANYYAYFPTDTAAAIAAFDLAYQDIKAAFAYYMANYNNGRPIIIASHSQGSTHAKRLLKEFFDGTELQPKLVVAYLAGMPIAPDYLQHIKPCTTPTATGCICSWRTFKEGHIDSFVQKETYTAIVTNPISWNADTPLVSRKANPGGVLRNFNKIIPGVANAEIHNGVLWTVKPHFFGNIFFNTTNYHIADFNLYYLSVRNNAKQRVNAYWHK